MVESISRKSKSYASSAGRANVEEAQQGDETSSLHLRASKSISKSISSRGNSRTLPLTVVKTGWSDRGRPVVDKVPVSPEGQIAGQKKTRG